MSISKSLTDSPIEHTKIIEIQRGVATKDLNSTAVEERYYR
jgi:hypothetical protein